MPPCAWQPWSIRSSGLDFVISRRALARAVTGWVGLALARSELRRTSEVVTSELAAIAVLRLRRNAGEITGADLAMRKLER